MHDFAGPITVSAELVLVTLAVMHTTGNGPKGQCRRLLLAGSLKTS